MTRSPLEFIRSIYNSNIDLCLFLLLLIIYKIIKNDIYIELVKCNLTILVIEDPFPSQIFILNDIGDIYHN
jgi:hypothetical protein